MLKMICRLVANSSIGWKPKTAVLVLIFGGTYDEIQTHQLFAYTLGDNRKVSIHFSAKGNQTHITENFEAETMNPVDIQREGWQAILDNFKGYVEGESF